MTTEDFESILSRGYEINGVEFKGPGSRTDKPFFAKVVRAILGMANRRDGGLVIIGVDEVNDVVEAKKLDPVGLKNEDLVTWTNYDELSGAVNEYASPSVSFDLDPPLIYDSKSFVIIRIREFDDIPILCSREYLDKKKNAPTLRKGACYVRSRHKPETAEIPSEEEMRELLELAIDKGVRRFVTRAQKAGLFNPAQSTPPSPTDEDQFRKQIEEMG